MTETPIAPSTALTQTTAAVAPIPRVPLNDMLALVRDTELIATYGREIIESQLAINRFDQDWRLARVFAESGLFADAAQVNQAMTKVQLGRSWKMDAADAMQHIYFVNGKPAVQNEYLGAKMRDSGLTWDIEWHRDKDVCIGVTLWPKRLGVAGTFEPIMERSQGKEIPASVSFTKADADRVKVKEDNKWISLSEKSTYKSYPEDMYFWRAIARLRRRYATNILSGVLTRDEADEISAPVETAPVREKLEVVEPITSGKQSRRKAGAEMIPGTEVPGTKADVFEFGAAANHPISQPDPVTVEAQPKVETVKAEPAPGSQPTAPAVDPAKRWPDTTGPWEEQSAMIAAFRAEMQRMGGNVEFNRHMNAFQASNPTFMFGNATFRDPASIAFYKYLQTIKVDAPAEEPPAGEKKKLFGSAPTRS